MGVVSISEGLRQHRIPSYMHDAVRRYALEHLPGGGFLMAVLRNDLAGAVRRADSTNREALTRWVEFVYTFLPAQSHGSPDAVKKWLALRKEKNT